MQEIQHLPNVERVSNSNTHLERISNSNTLVVLFNLLRFKFHQRIRVSVEGQGTMATSWAIRSMSLRETVTALPSASLIPMESRQRIRVTVTLRVTVVIVVAVTLRVTVAVVVAIRPLGGLGFGLGLGLWEACRRSREDQTTCGEQILSPPIRVRAD